MHHYYLTEKRHENATASIYATHYACATGFTFDDLLKSGEKDLVSLANQIALGQKESVFRQTLEDAFQSSPALIICAIIREMVPDEVFSNGWVTIDVVLGEKPARNQLGILVAERYGIELWKLTSPFILRV